MKKYATVIGGSNIDLTGVPLQNLVPETSNPGRIYRSPGGVGRNIAHNLALLGVPTYLLSSLGDDAFGREILEETRQAGVGVEHLRVLRGERSGIYLSVLGERHDLAVAVSDMEVMRTIDTEYLTQHENLLSQSSIVVLETNLETESLRHAVELCRKHRIPYLIEPVSIEKSKKLLDIPGQLDTISPNLSELATLSRNMGTGDVLTKPEATRSSLETLAQSVREKFENLLVTLGKKGVFSFGRDEARGKIYPAFATQVLDVNGAGDAFVAGFVCGRFYEYELERCIRLGLAAACLTLQSEQTVNSELSFEHCKILME